MPASELVVHHKYASGSCDDLSGHGNHGHTTAVPRSPDGIVFDGHSTRVVVFPSSSLAGLGGIRARARVCVDELGDRRTIMEGYLAFSFSAEPDGALAGSILTGQEWHEIRTPPSTVPLHRWVDVSYSYDGTDSAAISLDGRIVAAQYANLGSIGAIDWPYGLNIGAWPDDATRVFCGRMTEVWLWRRTLT
jgi:hypothetical protein